jgi:DeoR/GlpR family transcriptional regulator of sugar metabolism
MTSARGRDQARPTRDEGRAHARADTTLLVAERQRQIRRWLVERGSVRVAELAQRVRVSEETIRRDLRALAGEGIASIVHGGAIVRTFDHTGERGVPPVDRRQNVEQQAKNAIGSAAAAVVSNGEIVIVDAGTTTLAVARALHAHRDLTIVTNSLTVAQVAATLPAATTHVIGGKLVNASLSMIGPKAQRDLEPVRADWAFLGAAAIDASGGFTSADPYEAEVKRAMIRSARRVAIVADHTKFGARRFASFADASDIDYLFTTDGLAPASRRWLDKAGVKVVVCDAGGTRTRSRTA